MSSYHERYEQAIANGCTPRMADMLAARIAPGTKGTDRTFLEGNHNSLGLGDMPLQMQKWYVAEAKRDGVSVEGKQYKSSLAERPGDPRAWVSDVGDVLRLCEERNYRCEGAVNHKPREVEPEPDIPLSERLIKENMQEALLKEPRKALNLRELREEVIHKHGAPARAKPGRKVQRARR